jgi:hypothetical protein
VLAALAEQREASGSQLEVVVVTEPDHEIVERVSRDVGHLAAYLAHEVLVRLREMEERRALAAMDPFHHAPLLECLERPVHGRWRDRRMDRMEAARDVFDGEMLVRAREQLDDGASRRGDPFAARPDLIEDATRVVGWKVLDHDVLARGA